MVEKLLNIVNQVLAYGGESMSKLYKTNQDSLKSVNIIKSENTYSISEADKKSLTSPVSLEVALIKLQRQLIIENKRPRTIESYMKWSNNFFDFCRDRFDAYYTDELSPQMLYDWLSIMDVKETTKNIRLKSVKSMLSRCNHNGWIFNNWWKQIQIKVDDEYCISFEPPVRRNKPVVAEF